MEWRDPEDGLKNIRATDYTSGQGSDEFSASFPSTSSETVVEVALYITDFPTERIDNAKQLHDLFVHRGLELLSDRVLVENGRVKFTTTSGASLKSDNVLEALQHRDKRRQTTARQQWEHAKIQKKQRAEERVIAKAKAAEKRIAALKKVEEREEAQLQWLRARREYRRKRLDETHKRRHKQAKQQDIDSLFSDE